MPPAKKITDPGKREKPTKVASVIDDSTLLIYKGIMEDIEPVLTDEINDIEVMEGILGKVYIRLVKIVLANQGIGAKIAPDVDLEDLVAKLKKGSPVPV